MRDASSPPLISLVILSWNRRPELAMTLDQVMAEDEPAREVIVVDNASTDGSAEMVAVRHPGAILMRMPDNVGIAGLNAGIERACGDFVVLLDDDSHPARGTLGRMVQKFEQNPRLAAAAFTIRTALDDRLAWPLPDEIYADGRAMTFIGCGVGLRRKVLSSVGGFEPEYFLYLNELYLTARMIDAGFEVRHYPDLVAYHRVAQANRSTTRSVYYRNRNALWFVWAHLPLTVALWISLKRIIFMSAYYLAKGERGHFTTLQRGFRDALAGWDRMRSRRHRLSPATVEYLRPYLKKWI